LESNKIGELLRGAILIAIAVFMAVLLHKVHVFLTERGISIKDVIVFPIALIGAICWLTYRGVKAVVSAFRQTE
jgi:predicted PurR-regulated permease PerM